MRKHAKKIVSLALATAMSLSCFVASATWEFSGYDLSDLSNVTKTYTEVENGLFTGNQIIDPVAAEDVKWIPSGYEYAYPHRGFERLFVEGDSQNIVRITGEAPEYETRYVCYMWEAAYPHQIYIRRQTYFPEWGWVWDYGNDELGIPDSEVCIGLTDEVRKTIPYVWEPCCNISATDNNVSKYVTYEWKPYGIGPYDYNGKYVDADVIELYNYFLGSDIRTTFTAPIFSVESLSAKDETGRYVVTDEMLANAVNATYTKFVTGPSFYSENPTKDVAQMFIDNKLGRRTWDWDSDVVITDPERVNISWTEQQYEAGTNRYYQYLIVNGVVFDGREGTDLPAIFRYTGGYANPDAYWLTRFCESDPYYADIHVDDTYFPPVTDLDFIHLRADGRLGYNIYK